jgi:AcrR family transcriptional regulator
MAAAKRSRSHSRSVDLEQIVTAAAELFDEKGYQNTTMQDLAEYLGITKPTLYTRTSSKAKLLELIFRRVTDEAEKVVADLEGSYATRIAEAVRGWTISSVQLRAHYKVFFADERELPPNLVKSFRKWSGRNIENLRSIISEGQKNGEFRTELDSRVVAFDVIAIGHWTAKWFDEEGPLTLDEIAETQCRLFLNGLLV